MSSLWATLNEGVCRRGIKYKMSRSYLNNLVLHDMNDSFVRLFDFLFLENLGTLSLMNF